MIGNAELHGELHPASSAENASNDKSLKTSRPAPATTLPTPATTVPTPQNNEPPARGIVTNSLWDIDT